MTAGDLRFLIRPTTTFHRFERYNRSRCNSFLLRSRPGMRTRYRPAMLMYVLRVGPLVPMPSLMTWTSTSWPRLKMSWMSGLGRPAPGRPPMRRPRRPPRRASRRSPARPRAGQLLVLVEGGQALVGDVVLEFAEVGRPPLPPRLGRGLELFLLGL